MNEDSSLIFHCAPTLAEMMHSSQNPRLLHLLFLTQNGKRIQCSACRGTLFCYLRSSDQLSLSICKTTAGHLHEMVHGTCASSGPLMWSPFSAAPKPRQKQLSERILHMDLLVHVWHLRHHIAICCKVSHRHKSVWAREENKHGRSRFCLAVDVFVCSLKQSLRRFENTCFVSMSNTGGLLQTRPDV